MARKSLDDFLSEFGNPGKCQIVYGIIIVSILMQWSLVQQFNPIISYIPDHYCKIPLNAPSNSTSDACSVYTRNSNGNEEKLPCQNGWEYKTLRGEVFPSNEFNLICDREHLFRLALTMAYIGVMVGSLTFGFLSDKFGRKRIIALMIPSLSIVNIGCAFSPNLTIFIITRFLAGIFTQGIQTIFASYISELFRQKARTIIYYIFAFSNAVLLPVQMYMMYFLLNWRLVLFINATSLVLSVITSWFLPESVAWLISKNKLERAKSILEKFAELNKLPISKTLDEDLKEQAEEFLHKQSKSSIRNYRMLFCHSSLSRIILSISFIMFANQMVDSGLTLAISALDGDLYSNYLTNGVIQIITIAIFLPLFNWFGRVKIFSLLFASSGLLCIGGYLLMFYFKNSEAIHFIGLIMALVSRNLTEAIDAMVSIFASELLPTFLRSTGIGVGHLSGRLGSTLTPQILYTLNYIWEPLPQTVYGILMLMSVVVIRFLPETFNKFLPRTIEDVEELMGRSRDEENKPLLQAETKSSPKISYKSLSE